MVFSSLEFLFAFLPVTLGAYWLAPRRARNTVLLVASLAFYTWGGGAFVFALLGVIAANFVLGFAVARRGDRSAERRRRWGVAAAVLVNMGLLAYFKYANFFVGQVDGLRGALDLGSTDWAAVTLPIGISFFTFQAMSYTVDVARGTRVPLRNPIDFALYVALFPQLIAGPIVRFHEISDQLGNRRAGMDAFAEGAVRFTHGLVKKIVVADAVAVVADAAFATPPGELNAVTAWLGVTAYTLQIYFDFSGYSDMAIGLGRMFGFRFPENFARPYSAVSVTDFWRRWHMTLSNWFRDYLFIPLGGSRDGSGRTYRNLWIVFLLTGLWHGAAWTFVAWGAYHGALLVAERFMEQRPTGSTNLVPLRRAATLLAVMVGWVLFRAETLTGALGYLRAMVAPGSLEIVPRVAEVLDVRVTLVLALASLVVLLPRHLVLGPTLERARGAAPAVARLAVLGLALPYALLLMAGGSFSPFLYFRF
ncbi:MAG: MBOAT family O-acyltransferase [Egibacteraceae bacterium]